MSTNYYLQTQGHDDPLHIGKSSYGWTFALHVIPELGIHTLDDWRERWSMAGNRIINEYDEPISADELEKIITERSGMAWQRAGIDGVHCVGHAAGSWDYFAGEFC